MAPSPKSSEVELGYISGTFGVRGEVRVHLHNRESDFLNRSRRVTLVGPAGERVAAKLKCRPGAGKRVLGHLPHVGNREDASALKGWKIVVPSDALPALEDGEFYVWRVIGLPAMIGGERVGTVTEVHSSGPVDIFEIRTDDGPRFVPALKDALTVDIEAGRIELAADALVEGA